MVFKGLLYLVRLWSPRDLSVTVAVNVCLRVSCVPRGDRFTLPPRATLHSHLSATPLGRSRSGSGRASDRETVFGDECRIRNPGKTTNSNPMTRLEISRTCRVRVSGVARREHVSLKSVARPP